MPYGRGSRATIDTQSHFRKRSALNAEMVSSRKRVKDSPHGKEFDTYKVGTTANSTSTMHKLASTPITLDCFEIDDYAPDVVYFTHDGDTLTDYTVSDIASNIIEDLEALRQKYNETKDKRYWKELIRWLPNGWLQTRTVTMNYENLRSMYHQREHHKLTEWHAFCDWVKTLPYAEELIIN